MTVLVALPTTQGLFSALGLTCGAEAVYIDAFQGTNQLTGTPCASAAIS